MLAALKKWFSLLDRRLERAPFSLPDAKFILYDKFDQQLRVTSQYKNGYEKEWLTIDPQLSLMAMQHAGVLTISDVRLMAYLNDGGDYQANLLLSDTFGLPIHFPFKRTWSLRGILRKIFLAKELWWGRKITHSGRCVVLGTSNSSNYYHFWTEVVADWWMLQQVGFTPADFDLFLVLGLRAPWQEQLLKIIGIPFEKTWWLPDHILAVSQLTYTARTKGSATQIPLWLCRSIIEIAGSHLLDKDNKLIEKGGEKKIIISRGDATKRRLRNESILIAPLKSAGFEVHQLENKTIAEQASLFSQARIIVAEHGAALTNIVWCSKHCFVIDIHASIKAVPCFKLLAQQVGLRYQAIFNAAAIKYDDGDWEISKAAVEDIIKIIL